MKADGTRELHDTPCRGRCTTTALGDEVCRGCGRTKDEVLNWNLMSIQKKIEINERVKSWQKK